jgi:hypothetical protein
MVEICKSHLPCAGERFFCNRTLSDQQSQDDPGRAHETGRSRGPIRSQPEACSGRWPRPQQPEQALDVVSKSSDALCDRPDPIKPQGIDRQAAQRGQDLNAVLLPIPAGVFPQRHIPHPVPAVLDRPALPNGSEQGLCSSAQTRDVVTSLVLRLALAGVMAAHSDDRRAARPLLYHPLRCRHRP